MILNYIHWNPNPEIINIFGISIRYYGLLFAGGLILCIYILRWIYKRENIPSEHLDKLTILGIVGIVLGARLGHCLFYEPSYYLSHPLEILQIWSGGLASHGGVVGILVALFFYSRKTKHSVIETLDLIAVVSGILFGFIRLGNFINSEIIGMPTTKPWGVIFERVDNIPRHPTQLYEAISYLIIFTAMMILYKMRRDRLRNGFFFGLGSVLFFTTRFLLEFIKEDQVGFEEGLTFNMGQLLSVPFILVGIGFMIYGLWKTKKLSAQQACKTNADKDSHLSEGITAHGLTG
jgi:phosphatidylglycerol---prolipoprotein diacylglyceryl transferase